MDKVEFTPEVKAWNAELEASLKREKEFRKEGRRIVQIYEADKGEDTPFNILYSNTETLAPALYNNVPRPVVDRRYKDADPLGKVASLVTKRSLDYLLDSNDQDYSNFDDMMKSAVLEALLPGRGLTRFKYDASIVGETGAQKVESESVCGEEVPWDRIRFGYAKKWKDVPWIAFEHFMNKDEVEKNFDADIAAKMEYPIKGGQEDAEADGEGKDSAKVSEEETEKLAHIFEIWDKTKKKIIFIAAGYGEVLKSVDDPLGLSSFYPCPRPLQFTMKVSSIMPTPLYLMYESQAEELNVCTNRIDKITRALKVRGFYDSTLTGLDALLGAPDNTLLPAENVSAMLQGQTLDKAIWLFPVEKLVGVLQQLYQQRASIKEVIYEITGVSDILRGSSQASETATAQNIKNQWGTLRLKKSQREVQRYVRDCLRIMAEIAVEKLSSETLGAMTGLQYPTGEQKQTARGLMQRLQATQPPAMPGQPPQPPDPQMLQLQKILSQPSWDDILGILRNDLQRHYRIDIETNSTVDAEATEDKADVAEFLNAISQFLNGIAPMIEQGYMQFDVAKTMLLAIVRRFRFGTEVEDQINEMQAPQKGPQDDPKAQADAAKAKADQANAEAQAQFQQAKLASDTELGKQEAAARMAKLQSDQELATIDAGIRREKMQLDRELAVAQHALKMEQIAAQTEQARAQAATAKETAKAGKGE